jgi:hypothetical protein
MFTNIVLCEKNSKYLEEEAKLNLKLKLVIHFIMVQWNQHVIEVCMATSRKQK